jgi:UDP-N-acetylglucosamine--N-acetylmuramyl-(pentapeptide) pyrophosphoryl-undecaprenol N-acetylglucosamine transferase
VLNGAIAEYLRDHSGDGDLAVRQVAGERFAAAVGVVEPVGDGVLHQVLGFEPRMPSMYAAVDLLIGRGGASTVHEVAVTGTPAILVPWAASADDHQTENVRWLSEVGGALLLPEGDLDRLGREIDRLRADEEALAALGAAAYSRGEVHRSGALAHLIERVAVTS